MAKVKAEEKIFFPEGHVYVLWYVDYTEGYGVEVFGENGIDGDLVSMNDWSFGQNEQAYLLSHRWFMYVVEDIKNNGPEPSEHIERVELYYPDIQDDIKVVKELLSIKGRTVEIHCYVDQLILNEDGQYDKFGSAWFTVPHDWAETMAKNNGFESLERFFLEYTYDNVDGWLEQAIEDGVLEGCGTGSTATEDWSDK